jgi:cell division septation protein DedD
LAAELKAAGFPAYVEPEAAGSPWHRVRVGRYATRAAVEKVLVRLEKRRSEKLWVIRER